MPAAPGPNDLDAYGQTVYQRAHLVFSDGVMLVVQRGSDIRDISGNSLIGVARTATLSDFTDDAAAAAGGIAVGSLYRTASAVKIRVA